jgi:chaperonin cofactor prefoldin
MEERIDPRWEITKQVSQVQPDISTIESALDNLKPSSLEYLDICMRNLESLAPCNPLSEVLIKRLEEAKNTEVGRLEVETVEAVRNLKRGKRIGEIHKVLHALEKIREDEKVFREKLAGYIFFFENLKELDEDTYFAQAVDIFYSKLLDRETISDKTKKAEEEKSRKGREIWTDYFFSESGNCVARRYYVKEGKLQSADTRI